MYIIAFSSPCGPIILIFNQPYKFRQYQPKWRGSWMCDFWPLPRDITKTEHDRPDVIMDL